MYVCHCNRIPERDILAAIDRIRARAPSTPAAPGDVLLELNRQGKCLGCFPLIAGMLDTPRDRAGHSVLKNYSGSDISPVWNALQATAKPRRRGGSFARRAKA